MATKVIHDIGKKIKFLRNKNEFKQSDLAEITGTTKGLISKIENGRTVPSLPVLITILQALKVDFKEFFGDIAIEKGSNFYVIRAEDVQKIYKEDASGFEYGFIFTKPVNSTILEVTLLTIQPHSRRDPISTDAYEFKYIISGEVQYEIGDEKVNLKAGDSLFFDGRIMHVPRNITLEPVTMLVVYLF